ncbi:MAG: alpha-amylase [Bacteroidales bacterium]|nr:alpha-amylase [Bacteroidales bacterium]
MKKHILPLASAVLALAACTGVNSGSYFNEKASLASICTLESDTTIMLVRDYFPAIGTISSFKSDIAQVSSLSAGNDTLMILTSADSQHLGTLTITSEGESGSIILKKKEDISAGRPHITTVGASSDGKSFYVRSDSEGLYLALWQNSVIPATNLQKSGEREFKVTVPAAAAKMRRSFIRIIEVCANGVSGDILVPIEYGKVIVSTDKLDRHDRQAMVMYQILLDRFYNGNPANDWKINNPKEVLPKVDYWGGDIAGVTAKLRDGYLDRLGVNTLWISPITQNPMDAWGLNQDPYTKFSGYHGYWPYYLTKLDARFGSEEELREMLTTAHQHGDNVLLDYVANHAHIASPTLTEHPDWTTPDTTPDGRPNFELWDEFRLTTWFDKHIPTLDLEREDVNEPLTDSALVWMRNFDFDGFRHDACKHIPEVYWRKLTQKLLKEFPDRNLFQIGETYGSPELISIYVKNGMLDSQFDFNVTDRFTDAFIWNKSFDEFANTVATSHDTYGGHNVMGIMTGNHDRSRFISLASGDVSPLEDQKMAGWKREIGVKDTLAYKKLSLLHAMVTTVPGVPCIYTGDEWGQPGANDPDNRRWSQFEPKNKFEASVNEQLRKMIATRNSSMPLLYGDWMLLCCEGDFIAWLRNYMGDWVITAINKGNSPVKKTLELPLGLKTADGKSSVDIETAPLGYQIITK